MCGICGVVDLSGRPIDDRIGRKMMHLLAHRGPDGDGSEQHTAEGEPVVFLGHRRLKIIDLSEAARQPIANEDGTVMVVFNGEIYNFLTLRSELQVRGHTFRSWSDTETIVHAYEEFGDDFVGHLDGMFAFALWDERGRRLILARDRSGKKPLYYAFDGTRLTFGSEIKAVLVCPWVPRDIAVEHLPELLVFGYVPSPRTLYRGIFQVPPASMVVLDTDGLCLTKPYWHLRFSDPRAGRPVPVLEAAGRVRLLLRDAVARRLISDVPIGALLSGGLDSSIVVGLMAEALTEPVRTFSVGFEGVASFDERPSAAIVARQFGTAHTEFVVRPDAAALLEQILWHHDQPYGDSSAIPTYLLSKLARQHVTVALNGDGGDEVFAGYERFFAALLAQRFPPALAPLGQAAARWLPDGLSYYSLRRR